MHGLTSELLFHKLMWWEKMNKFQIWEQELCNAHTTPQFPHPTQQTVFLYVYLNIFKDSWI